MWVSASLIGKHLGHGDLASGSRGSVPTAREYAPNRDLRERNALSLPRLPRVLEASQAPETYNLRDSKLNKHVQSRLFGSRSGMEAGVTANARIAVLACIGAVLGLQRFHGQNMVK